MSRPPVPDEALRLHRQAVQAYQTACGLARSGKKTLATKAFAETYQLVAASSAAWERRDTKEEEE